MGFKSISTRVSTATSAVSTQAVMINTGTGNLSISGSKITANTSITLGVITPGQTSSSSSVTAAGGPTITGIAYLDVNNNPTSANAVSTSGGNIQITGTGFVSGSSVYINNSLVSNTFVSSTQIRAICPAASAGNVSLMLFTPTLTGAMSGTGVRYSGIPSWTTSAVSFQNGSAANVSLVASSDSTLTYTLQAGSTLPTGISLVSSGYLSGTPTGYTTNTTGTIVLIATDAEGQAAQQTVNWTITVNEPQFPNTTLLLSAATTGQTASFVKDNSTNNYPLTVVGDTRAQSYSPYYGNGYYSNSFGGSSDYFTLPVSANLAFNADYTIECWVYLNSVSGTQGVYSSIDNSADSWVGVTLSFSGNSFVATSYISGPDAITHQTAVVAGQWYHLAVSRSGSTTKSYLNGVQSTGTTTSSYSLTQSGSSVGTLYPGSSPLNGYISNLRIVKGTALYTANFTPPTAPLTAVSGTQLLTCQSNRFIDNSSNALALTSAGTPKVTQAIPFAASSTYATYGSGYFDGTGDYLTTPYKTSLCQLSGNFTIECWLYWTAHGSYGGIFGSANSNTGAAITAGWYLDFNSATDNLQFEGQGSVSVVTTNTIPKNQWCHIAVVRNGTTITHYLNGVANGTGTSSQAFDSTANNFYVGVDRGVSATTTGYISDVRVNNSTAVYNSNFTPPTAPLTAVANTQLLTLQTNGAHNNSTFSDNSNFNNLITRTGNATNGTFSPYSATGWSNYFNGSADYLTAPSTAAAFGTNPWTIECWVYITSLATALIPIDTRASTSPNNGVQCSIGTNGAITWFEGSATTVAATSAAAVTANTWYHIAFVRSGTGSNQCTIYVNGVSAATGTSSLNHAGNTSYIGRNAAASQNFFPGYISNLRIVNGSAVYPSAFTPSTTPLTAVANTSLLTCQSNRFKDSSTNNYTITLAGTPSVQAFSPFNASNSYSAATNGGSVYLDGTGDYLSTPSSSQFTQGTGDFTIEFWAYLTASNTNIIDNRPAATNGNYLTISQGANNLPLVFVNSATKMTSSTALPLNSWGHIAYVRTSGVGYLYLNGVQVATAADTTAYIETTWRVGSAFGSPAAGYISDVRYSKSAVYTTTFTPPTAPLTPIPASTLLLINGSNGGIIDAHGTSNFETVGDAKVTTDKYPYSTAGQSYYFDGTGDYLSIPSNNTLDFGTGDFTIEFWVNFSALSTNRMILDRWASGNVNSWQLYWRATGTSLAFLVGASTVLLQDPTSNTITTNTWYHVAVTRASGSNKMFINGNVVATATNSTSLTSTLALGIGRQYSTSTNDFNGYLSDLRITKGFARYTANFSVPTTPFLGQ